MFSNFCYCILTLLIFLWLFLGDHSSLQTREGLATSSSGSRASDGISFGRIVSSGPPNGQNVSSAHRYPFAQVQPIALETGLDLVQGNTFVPAVQTGVVADQGLASGQAQGSETANAVVQGEEEENEEGRSNFSTDFVNSSSTEGNSWFSVAELMANSYPSKSRIVYLKSYKLFERFLKEKNQFVANSPPTEIQMLNYFHHLRNTLKWAPTTLWSTYARLNACVKRMYGFSMKSFVGVSACLKSFESGHRVKKASVFTPQQVLFILMHC